MKVCRQKTIVSKTICLINDVRVLHRTTRDICTTVVHRSLCTNECCSTLKSNIPKMPKMPPYVHYRTIIFCLRSHVTSITIRSYVLGQGFRAVMSCCEQTDLMSCYATAISWNTAVVSGLRSYSMVSLLQSVSAQSLLSGSCLVKSSRNIQRFYRDSLPPCSLILNISASSAPCMSYSVLSSVLCSLHDTTLVYCPRPDQHCWPLPLSANVSRQSRLSSLPDLSPLQFSTL